MKIGDLVFDSSLGRNGIIVDGRDFMGAWTVLYDDGQIYDAFDVELELRR